MRSHTAEGGGTLLQVKGLGKRFGGTEALRGVDFSVLPGEVHALLGANGAGKSTLIKILAGVYPADGGDIRVGGEPLDEASRRKIAFVHQDLGLIESMSVGENMAMGYGYPRRWKLIDWAAVESAAEKAIARLGLSLPLGRPVSELSRAEKSIVAIARALANDAELLVLDEPTASLPEADVSRLFSILLRLRDRGVGIIYVTHRLDEVFRIADALTVLRDGRTVAVYRPVAISPEQLVTDIVGRAPASRNFVRRKSDNRPALSMENLCVGTTGPVSFQVAAGEIVGLAGLRGAGHEAVGRVLGGVLARESGTVTVDGKPAALGSPGGAIAAGLSFTSGKRAEESLAGTLSVKENLFLNPLNFGQTRFGLRSRRKETEEARRILKRFDVRPPDPDRDISTLSGGNQQKVVLARSAGRRYRVLVLEDPTIGVDFGAKTEIYRMMAEQALEGTAMVVVSSDLDELVQIADRVLAFSRGHIVDELPRAELSVEALTQAVGGIGPSAGEATRAEARA